MFANDISNKGLISKIDKESIQFNIENLIKKVSRGPKQKFFSKEDMQIANRHVNSCLISLVIRKMQIKTTMV